MQRMKKSMAIGLVFIALLALAVGGIVNHPSFGKSPDGERLERIKRSPNYKDGMFVNREHTPLMTTNKSRWRVMWDNLTAPKPENIEPSSAVAAVKTDLNTLDLSRNMAVWFGHSSYLLVVEGRKILVDPVLEVGFPASLMMHPFKGSDIYAPEDIPAVDYLVITHDHYDHLDYGTVRAIRDRVGKVVCPLGVGAHLEHWGYPEDRIVEMDWDETNALDNSTRVTCLPARHFSGRFLKQNPTLWASFMIESEKGTTIYIGGDSGYGSHFAEIGERFPNIDLALLENGQYNTDWRYIHALPEQQADIIRALHAHHVLPVHHGKFALARHAWNEPLRRLKETVESDTTSFIIHAVIGQPVFIDE